MVSLCKGDVAGRAWEDAAQLHVSVPPLSFAPGRRAMPAAGQPPGAFRCARPAPGAQAGLLISLASKRARGPSLDENLTEKGLKPTWWGGEGNPVRPACAD